MLCSDVQARVFSDYDYERRPHTVDRGGGGSAWGSGCGRGRPSPSPSPSSPSSPSPPSPSLSSLPSSSSSLSEETKQEQEDAGGGVTIIPAGTAAVSEDKPKRKPAATADEQLTLQRLGQQCAAEREKVRQAARRGVVFGFCVDDDDGGGNGENDGSAGSSSGGGGGGGGGSKTGARAGAQQRRRVEAVQNGRVVEASFAKGEWGVRWRDDGG